MSRVGKNPVPVPAGVTAQIVEGVFVAKGKLGELKLPLSAEVEVVIEDGAVKVKPVSQSKQSRMMWGTTRNLARNLMQGVALGFSRNLEINGVGYRASVQGKKLVLQLGYSHDIEYPIPADIAIKCEKPTAITVSGADKQRVSQVAAEIRAFRKPKPYKGKGIKYEKEFIVRKEGKKK